MTPRDRKMIDDANLERAIRLSILEEEKRKESRQKVTFNPIVSEAHIDSRRDSFLDASLAFDDIAKRDSAESLGMARMQSEIPIRYNKQSSINQTAQATMTSDIVDKQIQSVVKRTSEPDSDGDEKIND